jgi:hypothetical protein
MAVAILDTSVDIYHWERGLYQDTLENLRRAYIIRHSAVVLSELRRGARARDAELFVASLLNWPRSDGSLPRPTGGRQAGLSETSATSKPGTYTSAETFRTMR